MVLGLILIGALVEESRFSTPSGLLERYVSRDDERDFSVKLTHPDGKVEWLEAIPQKFFSSDEKVFRQKRNDQEDVFLESMGEKTLLGHAPQVFEIDESSFTCEAAADVGFPTPLSDSANILISKLKCLSRTPQTETKSLRVIGKENKSWATCDPHEKACVWNQKFSSEPEAAVQTSTLAFLWTAEQSFQFHHLNPQMGLLTAKSWTGNVDKSLYNANNRTLNYGAGNYIDALDGFVVIHEWGHAVINDLNPGVYGYEAEVLHEAIADFIAADILDDSCFAPFDAQEVSNRKCVRDLSVSKNYLRDMTGENKHADSLVLSSALWDAKKLLPPGLALEATLESIIRLPKNPSLREFWVKFFRVYERLLAERNNLADKHSELAQIGEQHGF